MRAVAVRLLSAVFAAIVATVGIGSFVGIPADVRSLNSKIEAFERASFNNGRAVSPEERDKALTDAGYNFHLRTSESPPPPVIRTSLKAMVEGALIWHPAILFVSLIGSLLVFRPGRAGGCVLLVFFAPAAILMSSEVAVAVGLASLIYLGFEWWMNSKKMPTLRLGG